MKRVRFISADNEKNLNSTHSHSIVLKGQPSSTARCILCPRRYAFRAKKFFRFSCKTCGLKRLCYECMRLCHARHEILEIKHKDMSSTSSYCECGLRPRGCKLLPVIDEALEFTPKHRISAVIIQRAVRASITRLVLKRKAAEYKQTRYSVCVQYWNSEVLESVWLKMKTGIAQYHEELERQRMEIEEDHRRKYDYYLEQQKVVIRMNAMLYAIRYLLGITSIFVESGVKQIDERPSFAFSTYSIRNQQNYLHFSRRLPMSSIVKSAEFMPRYDSNETLYFDPDTRLLYCRYARDAANLTWLKKLEKLKLSRHETKVRAAREASNIRRKARMMKARVMKDAKEIHLREESGESLSLDTISISEEVQVPEHVQHRLHDIAAYRKNKLERLADEASIEEADDKTFECLQSNAVPLRRRHTITDPCHLYSRLLRLRQDLSLKAFSRRRSSLLPSMGVLRMPDTSVLRRSSYESVVRSLGLFAARNGQLLEFVDPQYSFLWEKIPRAARKRRMLLLSSLSWLNPRLPQELREWVRERRIRRRRTIADPERLAKQLQLMFMIRNNIGKLRYMALFEENSLLRRRSYDFGELKDHDDNILSRLGYQLEYPIISQSTDELISESKLMEERMMRMWLPDHLEEEERNLAFYLPENYFQEGKRSYQSDLQNMRHCWKEYLDPDTNQSFYYCEELGQSTWELPVGVDDFVLHRMFDAETGAWFYYNNETEESMWASIRPSS